MNNKTKLMFVGVGLIFSGTRSYGMEKDVESTTNKVLPLSKIKDNGKFAHYRLYDFSGEDSIFYRVGYGKQKPELHLQNNMDFSKDNPLITKFKDKTDLLGFEFFDSDGNLCGRYYKEKKGLDYNRLKSLLKKKPKVYIENYSLPMPKERRKANEKDDAEAIFYFARSKNEDILWEQEFRKEDLEKSQMLTKISSYIKENFR